MIAAYAYLHIVIIYYARKSFIGPSTTDFAFKKPMHRDVRKSTHILCIHGI